MSERIEFKWTTPPTRIVQRLVHNDKIGLFMAETCARYMDKFIPMDSGNLAQDYTTNPFKVTYEVPYAHRIYEGQGFNFRKDKHPLATARWDKAMWSAYKGDIAKELTDYIKRL